MNVFVDLEETVIDVFGKFPAFKRNGCKTVAQTIDRAMVHSISALGEPSVPVRVFIFSFAIHTPEEVEIFNTFILPDLLPRIGISKIDGVITVPQMWETSQVVQQIRFDDITEFIILRRKEGAFHDWCLKHHPGEVSVLLDDVVPNRTTQDHDTGTLIQTVRVEAWK